MGKREGEAGSPLPPLPNNYLQFRIFLRKCHLEGPPLMGITGPLFRIESGNPCGHIQFSGPDDLHRCLHQGHVVMGIREKIDIEDASLVPDETDRALRILCPKDQNLSLGHFGLCCRERFSGRILKRDDT
tara:strand:+ start:133 stop:522 length:390 start_codon:yes stop_codon:yes gene_type:complete